MLNNLHDRVLHVVAAKTRFWRHAIAQKGQVMKSVLAESKKLLERAKEQRRQVTPGQPDKNVHELAKEVGDELRKETRLSNRKLHRRVTV